MQPSGYSETINSKTEDTLLEAYDNAGVKRPKSSGPANDLSIVLDQIQLYESVNGETKFKKIKTPFKVIRVFLKYKV